MITNVTFTCRPNIIHPYEWGILDVKGLIFTRYLAVPIAHIALAVVAVFVEAIDAGNLTAADVVAVVGAAEFAEFDRLMSFHGTA